MIQKNITFTATQVNNEPIQIHYFTKFGEKITPKKILNESKRISEKVKKRGLRKMK